MTIDNGPDATFSEMIAEEIRVAMHRRRISQRQLAAHLHVSQSWISYRLTGAQEIGVNDLRMIADALGINVLDLIPREAVEAPRKVHPLEPRVVRRRRETSMSYATPDNGRRRAATQATPTTTLGHAAPPERTTRPRPSHPTPRPPVHPGPAPTGPGERRTGRVDQPGA